MARGLRADGPFLRDCAASQSASGHISCLGGAGLNSYNTRGAGSSRRGVIRGAADGRPGKHGNSAPDGV